MDNFDKDSENILSSVDRAYLDAQHDFYETNPPGILYHYTSANGLMGIIGKGGMFASPSFSMNDPSELEYGLSVVEEACLQISHASPSQAEVQIANALLSHPDVISKKYSSIPAVLLLISFSEAEDNLSQWRCYADDGYGYSVGIDTASIRIPHDNSEVPSNLMGLYGSWGFYKCIYDRKIQRQLVAKFIKLYARVITSYSVLSNQILTQVALAYLWDITSVFKHIAYKDEVEWRVRSAILKSQVNATHGFDAYSNGKTVKASKLISFNNKPVIKSIMMGPRNIETSGQFGLQVLLNKSTLVNKQSITVAFSDAPYR